MKVIVVGGGEVGYHLAERLSERSQDVTLIEMDPERARHAQEMLDIISLVGNGASLPVLQEAGVGRADMLLAVTSTDEVNLISCLAASRLGVKATVARVSNPEYFSRESVLSREELGISLMINPERECARETLNLLHSSAATEVVDFASGRVKLVGVKLGPDAPIAGRPLGELRRSLAGFDYVTAAVVRDGVTTIPDGDTVLRPDDHIFILSPREKIAKIPTFAGKGDFRLRRVMIAGGSREGLFLAQLLEKGGIGCTILDRDRARCLELAELLPRSLVLHADATDLELLEMEGVSGLDAFVAATGNDQTNLLSSLLAKTVGARKVVSLVHNFDYLPLVPKVGVDAAVSPRMSTINAILRYIRGGSVLRAATLTGTDAEVIEFLVTEEAAANGRSLRSLDFPRNAVIGAILRGEKVLVPSGTDVLQAGDDVVVFSLPDALPAVERLFQ